VSYGKCGEKLDTTMNGKAESQEVSAPERPVEIKIQQSQTTAPKEHIPDSGKMLLELSLQELRRWE
jgi:hypothetical protein